MQLFEEGHDRRNWAREMGVPLSPSYSAIKLDLNPQMRIRDNDVESGRKDQEVGKGGEEPVAPATTTTTTATGSTFTAMNTRGGGNGNGSNRLSDLVKSAKRHSETLRARNERVAESKRETRRRYGW